MTTTQSLGKPPSGLKWRSNTGFILSTISIGMFTDLFLYGLIVPVIPFILKDRLQIPHDQIQSYVSALLASYAGAQVLCSVPLGIIADKLPTRQLPFLIGLASLLASTTLLYIGSELYVLFIARTLQGLSASVVWTIGMAMILETVGSDNLGVTMGTIFGFISVGELAAPVLGGIVYKKAGSGAVFGMGFGLIALDFAMRVVVIEKKVARKYGLITPPASSAASTSDQINSDETSPLLPDPESQQSKADETEDVEKWKIPSTVKFPIMYAFSDRRMMTAGLVAFLQAFLLSVFDATVPLEAYDLFHFDSLSSGLLFIPLVLPSLLLGPIFGSLIDNKYGVKPIATIGFIYAIIPFILLRIPQAGGTGEIVKFCTFLCLCSIGLAAVGTPGMVEGSYVMERYYENNKELFSHEAPYAKLYAASSMVFSAGLTVGPLLSGWLREKIGYGNMNAVIAGLCAFGAMMCFLFLGGPPRAWRRKRG